jgi:hypothetical protein
MCGNEKLPGPVFWRPLQCECTPRRAKNRESFLASWEESSCPLNAGTGWSPATHAIVGQSQVLRCHPNIPHLSLVFWPQEFTVEPEEAVATSHKYSASVSANHLDGRCQQEMLRTFRWFGQRLRVIESRCGLSHPFPCCQSSWVDSHWVVSLFVGVALWVGDMHRSQRGRCSMGL